jgi:hypothetical protein
MKNFYAVHCDHYEDRNRNEILYCETRKKAVKLAIDFLLDPCSNARDIMMYILWEDPIYNIKDDNDRVRFINDATKYIEEHDSMIGFGDKNKDAYVEDGWGGVYITSEKFYESVKGLKLSKESAVSKANSHPYGIDGLSSHMAASGSDTPFNDNVAFSESESE